MESHARITQKELAERLRLSQSTVSRALGKSPLLPPKTIRKVLSEARKIGYRPDPALASLNSYLHAKRPISKGSLIAWLGRHSPLEMRTSCTWDLNVLHAAQACGEELGYKVEYFWFHDPKLPLRRLEQILTARNVLGIVLDTQPYSHGRLPMKLDRFSVVAIGRTLHSPKVDQIAPDQFQAAVRCYRQLIRRGYRRIGMAISKTFNERSLGQWYAGYLLEQLRKKANPVIPILSCAESDERATSQWIQQWQPDAMITAIEDIPATERHRIDILRRLGKRVPEDIGVAFVNITESVPMTNFSGIEESLVGIGCGAIDILARSICNNLRGIPEARMVSLIEGKWRDGGTV